MRFTAYRFPSAGLRAQLEAAGPLALDWIGASEAAPSQHWAIAAWQGAPPSALAAHERPAAESPRWWAGVPLPAPPEPIRREDMPELTQVQFRAATRAAGLTAAQVEAAINALPTAAARDDAMDRWRYGQRFLRSDALLAQLAGALGLTPAQVDALWLTAAAGN